MAEAIFWLSVFVLAYGYLGFPATVAAVGALWRRRVNKDRITPSVSLIIAAHNEEDVIEERVLNALATEYPKEQLEIIIASDGSSDRTEEIVSRFSDRGVRLLALPRVGKNAALAAAVRASSGDILVFSDANIYPEPGALKALVENFADPKVGGVSGHAIYRLADGSESSSRGEKLYFAYDTWLKEMENLTGSIVSAHGAFYAIRRELYETPPDLGAADDFMISTAVIRQGHRLVFERNARAYELAIPEAKREFRRRVRIMTMGLRATTLRRSLLNPFRHGFYSYVLFCHKVLRRLLPLALVPLLISSLYLAARHPFFLLASIAQILFYGLAIAGYLLRRSQLGHRKLFMMPFYYCMANIAALVALGDFLRGERIELWQPQRHAGAT